MPWIWGLMSCCSLICAAETVHTMPAEWIAPGWPAAWRPGSRLVVCQIAKHEGLLVHVLHTFHSIIYLFIFSLISCVFLRSWAKPGLIPLCFILRAKGSNNLQLISGGKKSLQTPLWPTAPVFSPSLSTANVALGGIWCVKGPREDEKQVVGEKGGTISAYLFSWELEQYKSRWAVMSTAWEDIWSLLWILWWQDSYSFHFYVAPAVGDSLAKATNTKITCSPFHAVFLELWFEVIDGEEGKARLAERLLTEPWVMAFWPCNACWRLNGPREPATQYGRAISNGRAETMEDVPAWPPAQLKRYNACTYITHEITHS